MPETDDPPTPSAAQPRLHPAERVVFFTDAVVAIAMTLLILPLMESVSEASGEGDATHWLGEHFGQLLAFVLSFVIIGQFWLTHHRYFKHVERLTQSMVVLNFVWLFTIVWLPIPTAMTGVMNWFSEDGHYDRVLIGLYIGTMVANSATMYVLQRLVLAHPETWAPDDPPTRRAEAVTLATLILFSLALVLALLLPQVNLFAMFVLGLTGPLQALLSRRMKADSVAQ